MDFIELMRLKKYRTIVPGLVTAYDEETNSVTAVPLMTDINNLKNPITDSNNISLYQVPCVMIGGVLGSITWPYTAGDMGLLLVSDRDIDNLKAARGAAQVASRDIGNLKDSFFLGGLFLTGSSGILIKSTISITLEVGSNSIVIDASGVKINNIDFLDHTHSGVSTGSDDTGPVVNL